MDRNREYTIDDFIVQKKIGEGSFGSVYKAVTKDTNEPVAIKKIKLSAANRSDIKNVAHEMRVLCSIDHPNIVSYKCSFWDKYQSNICIVMEYLGGGDLNNKITNLKRKRQLMSESQVWSYFIQMLKGLKILHDMKIIHRDIKTANIFLTHDESVLKLGDMNVSKVVEKDFTKTRVGTPLYFSPEIWNGKSYDYKTDIWSLGCVLYEMCALSYPFNGHSMNDLKYSANKGRYAPIPSIYSKDMNEMIKLCLQVDDYKRPTVYKLLEHPTIKDRMKKLDQTTVSDMVNVESKLIDTILIPYDFRKMKLPSKKMLPKRSNSISNIRQSRPSLSGSGVGDKENIFQQNFVSNANIAPVEKEPLVMQVQQQNIISKTPRVMNKNLPPPAPMKPPVPAAQVMGGMLPPKKPSVPQIHVPKLGRRLSGDFNSANPGLQIFNPLVVGGGGPISNRDPSPRNSNLYRVPSAGLMGVGRKPLGNLVPRPNYF